MHPLAREAFGSILRRVLGYGGTFLIARGIWTNEDAAIYIAAATGILLDLAWSYWQKFAARQKFLTAAAMSRPVTERQVEVAVKAGMSPPTSLGKNTIPHLEPVEKPLSDAGTSKE